MQPEPEIPPLEVNPQTGSVPPLLSGIQPPAHGDSPALLQAKPHPKALPVERMLAILLSLCLGLFLADAAVALADDSLILGLEIHLLTMIRGLLFFVSLLMTLLLYGLMGLIPAVPKRLFLPVALFNPVAGLVLIPIAIYSFGQLQRAAWGISFCEAILGLSILCRAQHGFRLRWPLVAEDQLGMQHFSWRHLSRFLLVNLVLVLPAVVVYLGVCAILAVDHFSDGFLALRRDGLTVQVRKYIRNDGKTIQLVPMSHIGLMICMDLVALRLRATQCPACRLRGGSLPARGWLFRGKAHGGTARSPTAIAVHTVPARLCFWISPFRGLKARPQCCEG